MKKNIYNFHGILEPIFPQKSFVLPVFKKEENYYIQIIDKENKLIDMKKIADDLLENIVQIGMTYQIKNLEKDVPIYAFFENNKKIAFGEFAYIKKYLLTNLDSFIDKPFLLFEIARFVKNKSFEKDATRLKEIKLMTDKHKKDSYVYYFEKNLEKQILENYSINNNYYDNLVYVTMMRNQMSMNGFVEKCSNIDTGFAMPVPYNNDNIWNSDKPLWENVLLSSFHKFYEPYCSLDKKDTNKDFIFNDNVKSHI